MEKLHLNVDDLSVDSFEPAKTSDGHGTVVGQADLVQGNGSLMECVYETSCIGGGYYCPIDPQINDGDGNDDGHDPADPFAPDANEDVIW